LIFNEIVYMLHDTFDQVLISEWHMPLLQGSCRVHTSVGRAILAACGGPTPY